MKAVLVLEDGTVFEGTAIGAEGTTTGEVVFHTAMTGYQEILTDPNNYGLIVTMTYPLIGNYGINPEDGISDKPAVKGFVVRELCKNPNNWRSTGDLDQYLKEHGITGIEGIDTRALTRILRRKGPMRGFISSQPGFHAETGKENIDFNTKSPCADDVSTKKILHYEGKGYRIGVLDLGLKNSIVDALKKRGCEVYVFPSQATSQDILAVNPDGIIITNGPGNPKELCMAIQTTQELMDKKPVFGICLGHLVTALANGADTTKLKYGHRGSNQPVKDIQKDITYITSQNHGYVVREDSIPKDRMKLTHINMNDGTVEGLQCIDKPVFTVQFLPEDAPGAMDTGYLYDRFLDMINKY